MSEGVRVEKGLPGGDIAQRLRGHYVAGLGDVRDFAPYVQPICIEAAEEIERGQEFFNSVACYFAEGAEFMDKIQLYDVFKAEFHKYLDGGKLSAWKPISTAPKDGTNFLYRWVARGEPMFRVVFFFKKDDMFVTTEGHVHLHDILIAREACWMPLPELPK